MNIAIVTGSGGLIGSESVHFLINKMDLVIGIDNDQRAYFFGKEASTKWNNIQLSGRYSNFTQYDLDIRDFDGLSDVFEKYNSDVKLVIHTAAQPSHDWAAKEPITDFTINANGTLHLLELCRKHCPGAVFIFTSTNKVYGDAPNFLPLRELANRWEIEDSHPYFEEGINEQMSIDQSKHSLFGVSKLAADVLVQEYGKYFGLKTGVFRGGCLTGPQHSGTMLHGFLSYLVKCAITKDEYTIFGYKGKQVRDNINAFDLVNMFWHYYKAPRVGEVYNAGGGRFSNCSVLEAIKICEQMTGNKMNVRYSDCNRVGDHIWYISDMSKFRRHYPEWNYKYSLETTTLQIFNSLKRRVQILQ